MTHSKLSHSFFLVAALGALALTSAGCAMNAGEPTSEETQSSEADLRKAPVATPTTQSKLDEGTVGNGNTMMPKAPIAPKLVDTDHVLGGGEEGDGPRPHPWEPTPENTTDNNSGSSGSSSSTK